MLRTAVCALKSQLTIDVAVNSSQCQRSILLIYCGKKNNNLISAFLADCLPSKIWFSAVGHPVFVGDLSLRHHSVCPAQGRVVCNSKTHIFLWDPLANTHTRIHERNRITVFSSRACWRLQEESAGWMDRGINDKLTFFWSPVPSHPILQDGKIKSSLWNISWCKMGPSIFSKKKKKTIMMSLAFFLSTLLLTR